MSSDCGRFSSETEQSWGFQPAPLNAAAACEKDFLKQLYPVAPGVKYPGSMKHTQTPALRSGPALGDFRANNHDLKLSKQSMEGQVTCLVSHNPKGNEDQVTFLSCSSIGS